MSLHLYRLSVNPLLPECFPIPKVCVLGRRDELNPFFNDKVLSLELRAPSAQSVDYISRRHARIIVKDDGTIKIFDDSLTGVFVNDIRINRIAFLEEGDVVTMGHPNGAKIIEGTYVRQSNSDFQFLFEKCSCSPDLSYPAVSRKNLVSASTRLFEVGEVSFCRSPSLHFQSDSDKLIGDASTEKSIIGKAFASSKASDSEDEKTLNDDLDNDSTFESPIVISSKTNLLKVRSHAKQHTDCLLDNDVFAVESEEDSEYISENEISSKTGVFSESHSELEDKSELISASEAISNQQPYDSNLVMFHNYASLESNSGCSDMVESYQSYSPSLVLENFDHVPHPLFLKMQPYTDVCIQMTYENVLNFLLLMEGVETLLNLVSEHDKGEVNSDVSLDFSPNFSESVCEMEFDFSGSCQSLCLQKLWRFPFTATLSEWLRKLLSLSKTSNTESEFDGVMYIGRNDCLLDNVGFCCSPFSRESLRYELLNLPLYLPLLNGKCHLSTKIFNSRSDFQFEGILFVNQIILLVKERTSIPLPYAEIKTRQVDDSCVSYLSTKELASEGCLHFKHDFKAFLTHWSDAIIPLPNATSPPKSVLKRKLTSNANATEISEPEHKIVVLPKELKAPTGYVHLSTKELVSEGCLSLGHFSNSVDIGDLCKVTIPLPYDYIVPEKNVEYNQSLDNKYIPLRKDYQFEAILPCVRTVHFLINFPTSRYLPFVEFSKNKIALDNFRCDAMFEGNGGLDVKIKKVTDEDLVENTVIPLNFKESTRKRKNYQIAVISTKRCKLHRTNNYDNYVFVEDLKFEGVLSKFDLQNNTVAQSISLAVIALPFNPVQDAIDTSSVLKEDLRFEGEFLTPNKDSLTKDISNRVPTILALPQSRFSNLKRKAREEIFFEKSLKRTSIISDKATSQHSKSNETHFVCVNNKNVFSDKELSQYASNKENSHFTNDAISLKFQEFKNQKVKEIMQNVNEHIDKQVPSGLQDCLLRRELIESAHVSLDELKKAVIQFSEGKHWVREIESIRNKLSLVNPTIAVVGDTGSGKSSLLNAVLGHPSLLPTSGLRACTAVVVEIAANTSNLCYRGEVEFLTKKEWNEEKELILKSVCYSDKEGKERFRHPETGTDAAIGWAKILAVHGRVSRDFGENHITNALGKMVVIEEENPEIFRSKVEKYIDSTSDDDDDKSPKYWPVVKLVKLKIPNPNRSLELGTKFVDLPGVQDANEARNQIAKKYLQQCDAVWIVADIVRAIDNRTAKELMGDTFRRQLFLDGRFSNLTFVCTKSDIVNCEEIVRSLKLTKETSFFQTIVNNRKEEVNTLEEECSQFTMEIDIRKSFLSENYDLTEDFKKMMECDIESFETQLRDKSLLKLRAEEDLMKNEKLMRKVCASARALRSKEQIKRDFVAGIKDMRRKANGQDEDFEDDASSEDGQFDEHAQGFKVFCVSSSDYLKLKGFNPGLTHVFEDARDTEIEDLIECSRQLVEQRSVEVVVKNLLSMMHLSLNFGSFLQTKTLQDEAVRKTASEIFQRHVSRLDLKPIVGRLGDGFEEAIRDNLRPNLEVGIDTAERVCRQKAKSWTEGKPSRGADKAGPITGLKWNQYQGTTQRDGHYDSPSYGTIDFNEDLSDPVYASITFSWDSVFAANGALSCLLNHFSEELVALVHDIVESAREELEQAGVPSTELARAAARASASVSGRARELRDATMAAVGEEQRRINRCMTPAIRRLMLPAYRECDRQKGTGMYQRMKLAMDRHLDLERKVIFSESADVLVAELSRLQASIAERAGEETERVREDIVEQFAPIWRGKRGAADADSTSRRRAAIDTVDVVIGDIEKLFRKANLSTKEFEDYFNQSLLDREREKLEAEKESERLEAESQRETEREKVEMDEGEEDLTITQDMFLDFSDSEF